MDIESRVELPYGHLVNLSPRPQRQTQYQAYRAHYTTNNLPANSPARNGHCVPTEPEDPRISPDTMFHKEKTTKLPMPKSIPDRARDQRQQTPSPTGIPKPSSAGISSGGSSGPSGDRNRDPCWRKIRNRFEKESPLSQRTSYIRTREGDRARSREAAEQSKYEQYPARTPSDDHPPSRGSNTRSAIPNPNTNVIRAVPHGRPEPTRNPEPYKKWRSEGEQWINQEPHGYVPQKLNMTDTSDYSAHSLDSVSPVSVEGSTMDCDWEDRFVVHMPSAKDPNPPTMTADQIEEYQKNIERVRRSGRKMPDTNTRPSPRSSLGDGKRDSSVHRERRRASVQYKTYDGRDSDSKEAQPEADRSAANNSQLHPSQAQGHYYSPDEIGKNRISTIWEESPTKAKDKRQSHIADGSFLGCKEINGPGTKDPDEILLFASGEDSTALQPRPLAIGAKKRQKEKASRAARKSDDKVALQEEWSQISQNSKHTQCLKQSSVTMCQDPNCAEQEVARPKSPSSKENSRPKESKENTPAKTDHGCGEDDVFIITPTITRTMIPTPTPEKSEKLEKSPKIENKAFVIKAQGLRRPGGIGQSGTGEAVKAVRAKAQVISTLSGLRPATKVAQAKSTTRSLSSSETNPLTSIPMTKKESIKEESAKDKYTKPTETATPEKEKEKSERASNSIRGFIRTSGLAKTTGIARSPTGSLATILRNGTESLRHRAESFRNGPSSLASRKSSSSAISQISPPSRDNSESSRSARSFRSAKETPPSSTNPSPVKVEPHSSRVSLEKPAPREKSPAVESQPPPKKTTPPTKKTSPPPEKMTLEKSTTAEKPSQADRLSRQERLERFKEQARARRATKVVEIAELDGQQVSGTKDSLQANITDVHDDLGDLDPADKGDEPPKESSNTVALSMIFEIVLMAITNMHKFGLQTTDSAYVKFMIINVLNMTRHCYHVFNTIYQTVSVYQATGTWPKARNDQAISRFLVEVLQAAVYLVILGFGALVLGRTAGYILLIGSWILWFAKPFTWAFRCFTRALIT